MQTFERDVWILYGSGSSAGVHWSPFGVTRASPKEVPVKSPARILPCPDAGHTLALVDDHTGGFVLYEPPVSHHPSDSGLLHRRASWMHAALVSPDQVLFAQHEEPLLSQLSVVTKRCNTPRFTERPVFCELNARVKEIVPSAYRGGARLSCYSDSDYTCKTQCAPCKHHRSTCAYVRNHDGTGGRVETSALPHRLPLYSEFGGERILHTRSCWPKKYDERQGVELDFAYYHGPVGREQLCCPPERHRLHKDTDEHYAPYCLYWRDDGSYVRLRDMMMVPSDAYVEAISCATEQPQPSRPYAWISRHILLRSVDCSSAHYPWLLPDSRTHRHDAVRMPFGKDSTRVELDDSHWMHYSSGFRCRQCSFRYSYSERMQPRSLQVLDLTRPESPVVLFAWNLHFPIRRLCMLPNGYVLVAMCVGIAILRPGTWDTIFSLPHALCGEGAVWIPGTLCTLQAALALAWAVPQVVRDLVLSFATFET